MYLAPSSRLYFDESEALPCKWLNHAKTKLYRFVLALLSIDVDECTSEDLNYCDTNAQCYNTPGSYECNCVLGYSGSGDSCEGMVWYYYLLCYNTPGRCKLQCATTFSTPCTLCDDKACSLYLLAQISNYACILLKKSS